MKQKHREKRSSEHLKRKPQDWCKRKVGQEHKWETIALWRETLESIIPSVGFKPRYGATIKCAHCGIEKYFGGQYHKPIDNLVAFLKIYPEAKAVIDIGKILLARSQNKYGYCFKYSYFPLQNFEVID